MNHDDELFFEALALPASERSLFLDRACGSDGALHGRVEALLASYEVAEKFLASPVTGRAAITPEEKQGDMIGRYKLLEIIGEGGCGVVWMAEQAEPVRRRVALKVIKLGMDTKEVVGRFEAERQALAMMDHPNVAKVFDAGTSHSGRPYFVMELVRGIPITRYCDEKNLPTVERLNLFIQACHAIQHAHQKGIIHRDIKPSNILVAQHDDAAVPKVIDFGIAKATQGRLTDATVFTAFAQFIGTPAYMSPEQAEFSGLDIDTRTDIYSLGVLLYELLTGRPPFDPKSLQQAGLDEIRRIIREVEPARPSTRLSTLSEADRTTVATLRGTAPAQLSTLLRGDLDWIVMKALEKNRTRRYETANGFAADLKRHLNNETVLARPPSAAYRFQKAFRRNRLIFSAAMAVAAALVVGLGISLRQTFAARKAQRETEVARTGEQQQRIAAQAAQNVAETEQKRADMQSRKASESQEQSRRLLYATDMNLAQQSLNVSNLGKASRLLDRHRPVAGEEDLRGWEWRYLWQLTRSSAVVTLASRSDPASSVSFSPDGSRLAVGWHRGRVELWDVPGRRLVRVLTDREQPHRGRVAFSPMRNLLAVNSEPRVVILYDLDSGRESVLWRAPEPDAWVVRNVGFSRDGSKALIYAGLHQERDEVSVVNVSSGQIESRHPTVFSPSLSGLLGGAQLSPDNRYLYLTRRYSIQCLDLATGRELWQTEPEKGTGLVTLALSPDGQVLASCAGFEDPTIRVGDAATGELLVRLAGHTGWVCQLVFSKDGRRLVSASNDQTIRFWDTRTWTETKVLRGHTDEVKSVAISESAQLVASAGKDGNLTLWKVDGQHATDGYRRLPADLGRDNVWPLDHSRVLMLPPGKPPESVDLKRDSPPRSLTEFGASNNVLGWFGPNLIFHWNGSHQILVHELRDMEFNQRGAFTLYSGTRPTGFAYNAKRQLLAWSEGSSPASVYLEGLAAPGRRIELKSDVPGLRPIRFSEDGNFLAAKVDSDVNRAGAGFREEGSDLPAKAANALRVWQVETGQIVATVAGTIGNAIFAAGGRVLAAVDIKGNGYEIGFYDLAHPGQPPRRFSGSGRSFSQAVSPDGGVVAATESNQVRLFDPARGEAIGPPLHGHLSQVYGIAFSPDGRRLISAGSAREAVKLWDVGTRQELLTLSSTGSIPWTARWSADGDAILTGPPWQAWTAPSWEEIAAAEAKEKTEIK